MIRHDHLKLIRESKTCPSPVPDVFEAGYPCQSFTKSGLQKGVADERGQVFLAGLETIMRTQSRCFVLEQVPDIALDPKFRPMFLRCLDVLRASGYLVEYKIMETLKNGLPQHRERVYVVGVRTDVDMLLSSTDSRSLIFMFAGLRHVAPCFTHAKEAWSSGHLPKRLGARAGSCYLEDEC